MRNLYFNPDTCKVFNPAEFAAMFLECHNQEGFKWIDTQDRPYSGTSINRNVWKYEYRYTLNEKPYTLTILKITK